MPAEGKQNASGLRPGDRILVVQDGSTDRLMPGSKADALVATVESKTTTKSVNGRRTLTRYNIHTDLGTVSDMAPIQTFWLATDKQVADAKAKKPVPPAQFSAPVIPDPRAAELVTANAKGTTRVVARPHTAPEPVQMPPGFVNGQRVHASIPDAPTLRCVDRSGCTEQATQQVAGRRHIRYCPRHGAEFEVRQQYVIDPWELETIR